MQYNTTFHGSWEGILHSIFPLFLLQTEIVGAR